MGGANDGGLGAEATLSGGLGAGAAEDALSGGLGAAEDDEATLSGGLGAGAAEDALSGASVPRRTILAVAGCLGATRRGGGLGGLERRRLATGRRTMEPSAAGSRGGASASGAFAFSCFFSAAASACSFSCGG